MQGLVGLQRVALRDQFYPNRVDTGMLLRTHGLPEALAFLPMSSSLFPEPPVLAPPLPTSLVSSQIACSKELFQLPFPLSPQFLLLILSLPRLFSSPSPRSFFLNSCFLRSSLAAGVWIDFL